MQIMIPQTAIYLSSSTTPKTHTHTPFVTTSGHQSTQQNTINHLHSGTNKDIKCSIYYSTIGIFYVNLEVMCGDYAYV